MRITQAFHGSFTGVELDIPATVVSVVFKLISIFLIAPVLAMNGMSPVLRYFKSNSLSSNSVALGSVLKRNVSVWFLKYCCPKKITWYWSPPLPVLWLVMRTWTSEATLTSRKSTIFIEDLMYCISHQVLLQSIKTFNFDRMLCCVKPTLDAISSTKMGTLIFFIGNCIYAIIVTGIM